MVVGPPPIQLEDLEEQEIWTKRHIGGNKMGKDTGRRWPMTNQGERRPGADLSLLALRRNQISQHLDLGLLSLPNYEKINFCYFSPQYMVYCCGFLG